MERALPGPAGQERSARQPLLKDTGSGKAPALKALKIPIVWGGWDSIPGLLGSPNTQMTVTHTGW